MDSESKDEEQVDKIVMTKICCTLYTQTLLMIQANFSSVLTLIKGLSECSISKNSIQDNQRVLIADIQTVPCAPGTHKFFG